jgi:hypothetical protein
VTDRESISAYVRLRAQQVGEYADGLPFSALEHRQIASQIRDELARLAEQIERGVDRHRDGQ